MKSDVAFFICPECFRVCEESGECHEHKMVACCPGEPGSLRRQPLTDAHGHMLSSAPRWFLEASGWIQAYAHYTPFSRPS